MAKSTKKSAKITSGLNKATHKRVKSIRRVARMAATFVLTEDEPTVKQASALALEQFGSSSLQAAVFKAVAAAMIDHAEDADEASEEESEEEATA